MQLKKITMQKKQEILHYILQKARTYNELATKKEEMRTLNALQDEILLDDTNA